MSSQESTSTRLAELERGATTAEALAFFDSRPPAQLADLMGNWRGGGLHTGHPMDGLLEVTGWRGKRFESPEIAHPLVFEDHRGQFSVNPALVPLKSAGSITSMLNNELLAKAGRRAIRLLATTKPVARLRMMDYRGVHTATMSYDAQPINDHFRLVDEDTLIGAMDMRGDASPFFFTLRRDS